MGLGAGSATPLQMVTAYAVFANGGYRIAPYLIAKIVDCQGQCPLRGEPVVAGENAERAIDPRNAWIMTSLLKDVIRVGTGDARAVAQPERPGRQDRHDERERRCVVLRVQRSVVGVSWIGFDQPRTLGTDETGGRAALPIWILVHGEGAEGNARGEAADARAASSP